MGHSRGSRSDAAQRPSGGLLGDSEGERELGIPAVVGAGNATEALKDGTLVTVSCAEGDTGRIYDGLLETEVNEVQRGTMPAISAKIMMNVSNPQLAFDFAQLPNDGDSFSTYRLP